MNKEKKLSAGRIVLTAAGILLAVILAVLALNHRAVRAVWCNLTAKKLALPEKDTWTGGETYLKVPYASVSENQYVDLYVPSSGQEEGTLPKLYVIIHGGGFVYNDSQSRQAVLMYRYFRDHGYACASVNYRLAQEAPFPGAVEDCKTAIRFLRAHAGDYGYDAETIAVFGESAGGYLATMCAVTDDSEFSDQPFIDEDLYKDVSAKTDVLVDYYGHIDNEGVSGDWKELGIPKAVLSIANSWVSGSVTQGYEDVESFWFRKNVSEMTQEEKDERDPHAYIDKNDLTGLDAWIIHGDADITVPYLQSVRLAEQLRTVPGIGDVELTLAPGMGHAADMLYSDEVLAELKTFMDGHLSE